MFESLGRREADYFDIPDLPLLIVPHPFANKSDEEMRQIASGLVLQVVAALTGRGSDR